MIYFNCFWYTFIHDRCTLISFFLLLSFISISIKNSSKIEKREEKNFWGTFFSYGNYKEVKNLKNYHEGDIWFAWWALASIFASIFKMFNNLCCQRLEMFKFIFLSKSLLNIFSTSKNIFFSVACLFLIKIPKFEFNGKDCEFFLVY